MNFSLLKKIFLTLLFFIISNTSSKAQDLLLSKEARVSVITCGTGNESYSLFGHTAIRVQDLANGIDLVYNYGAFDFNTPNFVMKFIKGNLQYFAVAHSYPDFISEYQYEKRSVYEQELNISIALKQKLYQSLTVSLASGESYYTYKFIDKNCTSMVVAIINQTLNTNVIVKKQDTTLTYRTILYPYFYGHFYEKLGTSIIFGKKVDQMGTQIFLPFELHKSLQKIYFQGHPLVVSNQTVLQYKNEIPFSWWNNAYSYSVVLLFIIFIRNKSISLFYLSMMAVIGLFFTFVGFYSEHLELGYNYNILLFNPSLLGLLYLYWIKNKRAIYGLAAFNILCLVIYCWLISNKAHFFLVLPLIATNTILLVRVLIQNKNKNYKLL